LLRIGATPKIQPATKAGEPNLTCRKPHSRRHIRYPAILIFEMQAEPARFKPTHEERR